MSKSRGFAPVEATCRHCRGSFIADFRIQVYCSPKCRLLSRVKIASDGCWIWQGFIDKGGYGRYGLGKFDTLAHRGSFRIFKGPVPDGKIICHRCNVRACVNPHHLYAGTYKTNADDRAAAGATIVPTVAGKDHPGFKHGRYVGRKKPGWVRPSAPELRQLKRAIPET